MDFRVMFIDSKYVLLERIDADDTKGGWHVMLSMYRALEDRYDEWVTFPTPQQARTFIERFGALETRQFLTRAEEAKKKKGKLAA